MATPSFTIGKIYTENINSSATALNINSPANFNGSSTQISAKLKNAKEVIGVYATSASDTINFNLITQSILYYTAAATGNFTINFRGDASVTLNSMMSDGECITAVFMCTNSSTAYYNSYVTVDGVTITPKWQGGTAPSTGNTSAIDMYTYTIIKTGNASFSVIASQTKYA